MGFLALYIFVLGATCQEAEPVVQPRSAPKVVKMAGEGPSEKFRHVYNSLLGEWRGDFVIYESEIGQRPGRQRRVIDQAFFDSLPLKEVNRIKVMHRYTGSDDFTVDAQIEDSWIDENGEEVLLKYPAQNYVKGNQLICRVEKPDETVVHTGTLDEENFIVWTRNVTNPLRREYFREKAEGDTYTIIGYGYYGDDDPSKSPKTWFKGVYHKMD